MARINVKTNMGRIEGDIDKTQTAVQYWCPECHELYRLEDCYLAILKLQGALSVMCPKHKTEAYLGKIRLDTMLHRESDE